MAQITRKRFRKLAVAMLNIFCLLLLSIIASYHWISYKSKGYIYQSVEAIPHNSIGLLLGTSKNFRGGKPNLFFRYRIEAAASLWKAGKISGIIVSGDNRYANYNEPKDMRNALIQMGVPDSVIVLDYAGFRTLDSVARARKVFGQWKMTIISQRFHTERAVFLARNMNIQAIGFEAQEVSAKLSASTLLREYFARFKAILDVYVLKTQPKFLGEPVPVPN